jgi:CheY-like chemotaxis protein
VRSSSGEGTTMDVTLVRVGATHVSAPPERAEAPIVARARTTPLRVLIVDDEPLIVRALGASIAHRAVVVGETTPERALARIMTEAPFDAIVCDVMMPGMTGVDLHQRVARDRPGAEARFVFVTGGTYTARTHEYLERVPNARLAKPLDVARLIDEIERVAGAEGSPINPRESDPQAPG